MNVNRSIPVWSIVAPVIAIAAMGGVAVGFDGLYMVAVGGALIGGVLAAVHHAEVVAHRVGEPFGTLLLAVAITIIEVALIVTLMLAGGPDAATLARDTVFAAVMIILTGIVGLCLLIGAIRYREQLIGWSGVSAALVTLTAICVLTLVLPNYTVTVRGPAFSNSQLLFVAIVSLLLYGIFIFVQTVRHRDYFLPPGARLSDNEHALPPSNRIAIFSGLLLLVCLAAVVLLAKALSPTLEAAVARAGAPKSVVGVIIAAVVLLPEGMAAVRAANNNRVQTSLNLSLGSALASIGLTIPAVAAVSLIAGLPLQIGIDSRSVILLVLSLFTIMVSMATGKTNVLQGTVLLLLFAVYIFTTIVP